MTLPSIVSAAAAGVRRANAPRPRWYQSEMRDNVLASWALGFDNVLAVLPTGGGKTVLFAMIVADHVGASCCIAHRQELVGQISMALARNGVRHRIIAPPTVVRAICQEHLAELGVCYYDPNASAGVAGVDTLLRRDDPWFKQVTLWVQDEAHHVLKENKWGKAAQLFPKAKGLGVTATPCRADGKGLGRHADGLFDVMHVGPTMRELINLGYLTDYRIVCAPTHIETAKARIGANGDYVLDRGNGKAAVRESTLVGDVVREYQRWASGKLGVVFTSDLDTAADIAEQFRAAGIPAEMVDGTTPDNVRRDVLRRFRRRELLVLVNVDLFGEGFDLPAIEVVQLARPTMSFALHAQQFGRALRLLIDKAYMAAWDDYTPEQRLAVIAASSKPRATIIDHVGNCIADGLGLPDSRNDWTLDAADRKSKGADDAEKTTNCLNPLCLSVYPRAKPACPYCGSKREQGGGGGARSIKTVDGDLLELDPETLAAMRGEVAKALPDLEAYRNRLSAQGLPHTHVLGQAKHHYARLQAAANLRDAMAWWAGEKRAVGQQDAEVYRRFYLTFGVDMLSAQTLDRAGMEALAARIDEKLTAPSLGARVRPT